MYFSLFLAFRHYWSLWTNFFTQFQPVERSQLFCPYNSSCGPPLFRPFQSKIGLLGQFVWPKGYLWTSLATFWLPWGPIWDTQRLANEPHWYSNLFLTQSIKIYGIEAYLAYFISYFYFYIFLPLLEPLGQFFISSTWKRDPISSVPDAPFCVPA